jgi:hypothetical protein
MSRNGHDFGVTRILFAAKAAPTFCVLLIARFVGAALAANRPKTLKISVNTDILPFTLAG